MIFSYNWLKQYVKGRFPNAPKLGELLTMHDFEVESLEKKGNDYNLNVKILPNRSDCLSHWGLAREIAVLIGGKMQPIKRLKIKKQNGKIKAIKLEIKSPAIAPRYSAIVIEGIKMKDSPNWLRKSLESAGIRSINNIVDLTNYIMLETGQPLHAFDYDKIVGQKMVLRKARAGEEVRTLDGKLHKLFDGVLVIEDKNSLIDLAGIMGGKESEVDYGTKNIILQAANFDRKSIYVAAKKLNHRTDASDIYAQGIDANLTMPALERANFLLEKLGGGKIVQIIDIYPKKVLPKKLKLEINYIASLLGVEIPMRSIINILRALEFKFSQKGKVLNIEVPTFRQDVSIREDMVEELGRIYGYENIKPEFPVTSLMPPRINENLAWENIVKNNLKEAGFYEVYNYSFISAKEAEDFGYSAEELVEIKNPTSAEYKYMRPTLITNLLKNVYKNQGQNHKQMRFFELGKVFLKKDLQELPMLTGLIFKQADKNEGFYEAKGVIDSISEKLGIDDVWYDEVGVKPEESKSKIWNLHKSGQVKIGEDEIGFLGELDGKLLSLFEIQGKVYAFDLDFGKIKKYVSEEREFEPIGQYPSAIRDLAVLVPQEVKVDDVLNIMEIAGGELVVDIDLFDIYEGEHLEQDKKSLAFRIICQAKDRTLNSEEINNLQEKIIKALEENPEWEVRR